MKRSSARLALAILLFMLPATARALPLVQPGWDLFTTVEDFTSFGGVPFEGVDLGSFDFGGSVGLVGGLGNTDTIVQRLGTAECVPDGPPFPCSDVIPIEIVALQLRSTVPIDLGAGLDFHFITLQSNRGLNVFDPAPGPASTGLLNISFDSIAGGTFTSSLNMWFDVRIGSLSGAILPVPLNGLIMSLNNPAVWGRTALPGAIIIDNVNDNLLRDGTNLGDFWPAANLLGPGQLGCNPHSIGTPPVHCISSATIPEPGTAALLGVGVLALLSIGRYLNRA